MDNFVVSARKYRPATFVSVVGQNHITSTLKNAIARSQLAHAYLFCGPRGVGKTTCARIFAKAINCLAPVDNEACGECESCRSFGEGRSFNIHELDAASNNSVDDIRSLTEQVRIPPQVGRYSVYIIDEVHMLSAAAFNAFLKTLEEPPAHAVFILATTEKHKIIPTILSRCQIFDFNRIRVEDAVGYLKYIASQEGVAADDESLHLISLKADGGMRDALSMFDKAVSFCGNDLRFKEVAQTLNVLDYDTYFNITSLIAQGDYPAVLTMFDEVLRKGFSPQSFAGGLNSHFRDLLMSKNPQTLSLLEVGGTLLERYKKQGGECQAGFLFHAIAVLTALDGTLRTATSQRLNVELALMKLCTPGQKKNSELNAESDPPAPAEENAELPGMVKAVRRPESTPHDAKMSAQAPVQAGSQPAPAKPAGAAQPAPAQPEGYARQGTITGTMQPAGTAQSEISPTTPETAAPEPAVPEQSGGQAVPEQTGVEQPGIGQAGTEQTTSEPAIPSAVPSVQGPSASAPPAEETLKNMSSDQAAPFAQSPAPPAEETLQNVSQEPVAPYAQPSTQATVQSGAPLTTPESSAPKSSAPPAEETLQSVSPEPVAPEPSVSAHAHPDAPSASASPTPHQPSRGKQSARKSILAGNSIGAILNQKKSDGDTAAAEGEDDAAIAEDPECERKIAENKVRFLNEVHRDRPRIAMALEEMVVSANRISLDVPTEALYEEIMRNRTEILSTLAEVAGIEGRIDFEVRVTHDDKVRKPVKAEDKLRFLTRKNPALTALRKELNLEIE